MTSGRAVHRRRASAKAQYHTSRPFRGPEGPRFCLKSVSVAPRVRIGFSDAEIVGAPFVPQGKPTRSVCRQAGLSAGRIVGATQTAHIQLSKSRPCGPSVPADLGHRASRSQDSEGQLRLLRSIPVSNYGSRLAESCAEGSWSKVQKKYSCSTTCPFCALDLYFNTHPERRPLKKRRPPSRSSTGTHSTPLARSPSASPQSGTLRRNRSGEEGGRYENKGKEPAGRRRYEGVC